MRHFPLAVLLAFVMSAFVALSGLTASMLSGCDGHSSAAPQHADTRTYQCPMSCVKPGESHPYQHVGPGDCVVCGMHLVPASVQPVPTKR